MQNKRSKNTFPGVLDNNHGIALFMTLWILVLLSVIVGEFCFFMGTEVKVTTNFKEQTEAYYIAYAGVQKAIEALINDKVTGHPCPAYERDGGSADMEEELNMWRINALLPPVPFAQGHFQVWLDNESGKVDLNSADTKILQMILNGLDLDDTIKEIIIDSILDWRDKDSLNHLNGAEDDYYLSLEKPYECKDDDFDSINELLLVKGITKELFYGGLKDLLTVSFRPTQKKGVSSRRRIKKKGITNKVNINAASPKMLRVFPFMTEEIIDKIIKYREEQDFFSMADFAEVVGNEIYQGVSGLITFRLSPYYTVKSVGTAETGKIKDIVNVNIEINRNYPKWHKVLAWFDGVKE